MTEDADLSDLLALFDTFRREGGRRRVGNNL